jgi:hypothetical protein
MTRIQGILNTFGDKILIAFDFQDMPVYRPYMAGHIGSILNRDDVRGNQKNLPHLWARWVLFMTRKLEFNYNHIS